MNFFRMEKPNGQTKTNIISSKARVAPSKPASIPGLELVAAVLGLRLTLAITRAVDQCISDAHLWCDSMNVLFLDSWPWQGVQILCHQKSRFSTKLYLNALQLIELLQ